MPKTIGIYFKDPHDAAQIRADLGQLARAYGVGTAPDDLLAAITNGVLELRPAKQKNAEGDIPADLPKLLQQCAALLRASGFPGHAQALESKANSLEQAFSAL